MAALLIVLLVIGVVGKQSRKYYAHVLGAVGAWIVLMPTALWVSSWIENPMVGILGFLFHGLAWAIPIVIIATGYESEAMYRLIPRRRTSGK